MKKLNVQILTYLNTKIVGTKVTPYSNRKGSKKEEVRQMFDNIAHSYDFLNHFFSMGIDVLWRKKAIRLIKKDNPEIILDMATGTGDFAVESARSIPGVKKVVGLDISQGMLDVGIKKIEKKKLNHIIELKQADSENIPIEDNYFDAFTVGFGVRNYQNLEKGLSEMLRVLKPGGIGVILEFSKPKKFPMKQLFAFYFKYIMPVIGKLLSKDSRAYSYLPESVQAFPEGEDFLNIMRKCGYRDVKQYPVTGGIASIYIGNK